MSTPRRDTYHHGQLRPELLARARALLDEGGPPAVSLREAARRAGVSATATYRHFRDKESLLAAVAAEGFREFGAALAASMQDDQPFSEMGRAYVEFALGHPGLFRLMFSPLLRQREAYPELAEASLHAFEALQRAAAAAPQASDERDINAAAIGWWSLVHGLSHLLLDGVLPMEFAPDPIAAVLGKPPPKARAAAP